MWESSLAFLSEISDTFRHEISRRDAVDWIFCFAPLLVFLELPRYYLSLMGVMIAQWMGYPKRDHEAEQAILDRSPMVSVVCAGLNESATIDECIRSLVDQDYENLEIIVVDDHSTDGMLEVARRWALTGRVRVIRNESARGRMGRGSATNVGVRVARGEIVVSCDADCTFDRRLVRELVAGFADPEVGWVAGNVLVRNQDTNFLTRSQTLEYLVSIDLHKRWTDLWGCTLQASGAIGAFRRDALLEIGGWDQELAEDTDISLRLIKQGWKGVFRPRAVTLTNVPDTWKVLTRQRTRWDQGGLRTYFRKHRRLMNPKVSGWTFASELWLEWFFSCFASIAYPFYFVWLLCQGLPLFLFVMGTCAAMYAVASMMILLPIAVVSERTGPIRHLLMPALTHALYKGYLRWVRFRAVLMEIFRIDYEDSFLPDSAWNHCPRW